MSHPLVMHQQRQQAAAPPAPSPSLATIARTPPGPSIGEQLVAGLLLGFAAFAVGSVVAAGATVIAGAISGSRKRDDDFNLESGDHLANPSWNYSLFHRGRQVYEGETGRPYDRPIEHLLAGKVFDAVEYDPTPSPKPLARLVEAARLAAYRKKYGRNPKYNLTDHG